MKEVKSEKVAVRVTPEQLAFLERCKQEDGHNTIQKVIYNLINKEMVIR
ncbi:TPA: hypothetical protein ACIU15_003974 [Yersinia enterocolitica]|nr:hypothetical protein [Yersinia enterocolitica]ELZ1905925.1 hypothetical protein [Yersinia enterocolitica]MCV3313396.1 hypothetical protein [Yersinia enterocolitica]UYJ91148.1 hypothetical protein N4228_09690 [Yersinia enterocolitica]UYJ95059.1 hypothetical protein N4225_09000 [Yersinia enterocolitica]UYK24629.1 hypothetical protein N4223_09690 [Yersinia enterocolitica]